jgi:hypothetical protein
MPKQVSQDACTSRQPWRTGVSETAQLHTCLNTSSISVRLLHDKGTWCGSMPYCSRNVSVVKCCRPGPLAPLAGLPGRRMSSPGRSSWKKSCSVGTVKSLFSILISLLFLNLILMRLSNRAEFQI